ncbi:MAG: hypothetical protein AAF485_28730, partial [Chloroflexota bacterium]
MASPTLTDTQSYNAFFNKHILNRLKYWGNQPALEQIDVPVLDTERERILKAISFGLTLTDAWPFVRDLMLRFTRYMERRG